MKQVALLLAFLFVLSSCASYTISKEDLAQQLKDNQASQKRSSFIPGNPPPAFLSFDFETYDSNGVKRILCVSSKGEKVYLLPNKDTQLEITSKSSGDVVRMYFDTVFLIENRLVGLRSRLVSSMSRAIAADDAMKREIALDDIEKIEILAEFPKTEKFQ